MRKTPFAIVAFAALAVSGMEASTRYVKPGAAGAADGTSWSDAFPTLQDALDVAFIGDQVWVAAGVYYPDEGAAHVDGDRTETFALGNSVQVFGGFCGYETALASRNPFAHPTVLSGDIDQDDVDADGNRIAETPADIAGGNSYHVVSSTAGTANTLLDGFTVTAGAADVAGNDTGGGLLLTGADPEIRDCRFTGNTADDRGGAMHLSASNPSIFNCLVAGNAAGNRGGGISTADGSLPSLLNCALRGNLADRGGAANFDGGTVDAVSLSFSGNHGTIEAGAIRGDNGATLDFRNVIVWNNLTAGFTTVSTSSIKLLGGATANYLYCLFENIILSGISSTNLDGTLATNDPLFIDEPDPSLAPFAGGDLRLGEASPVIDIGNNVVNAEPRDLAGQVRIADGDHDSTATIDFGAYEIGRVWFVDDNSPTPSTVANGLSWGTAFSFVQDALILAVAGDEIRIAEGVYYPDISTPGVAVSDTNDRAETFQLADGAVILGGFSDGGTAFDPDTYLAILSGDITQDDVDTDGNSIAETTADLAGDNSYSVVTGSGTGNFTVVEGCVITAGKADESPGTLSERNGGGLLNESGSPTLLRCTFSGHFVNQRGAAVYRVGAKIKWCVFE